MKKQMLHTMFVGLGIVSLGGTTFTAANYLSQLAPKTKVTTVETTQKSDTVVEAVPVAEKMKAQDTEAPVIKGNALTVAYGAKVNIKSGISASDNVDGDLTKEVVATGTVNTEKAGTYTVQYKVADKSGNQTSFTRKITVKEQVVEPQPAKAAVQSQASAAQGTTAQASPKTVAQTKTKTEKTVSTKQTLNILGRTISYQNGGQSSGQSIIDANPNTMVSTWGGASVQSNTDGLNTHFIGHNPGAFTVIFSLQKGNAIQVTDSTGHTATYHVTAIFKVNDNAVGVSDGVNYWDTLIGTGGGERITLQSCVNDSINLIVIAEK